MGRQPVVAALRSSHGPQFQDSVASVVGYQRGTPDISLSADRDGGLIVYSSFAPIQATYGVVGGTSLATPLFAGIVALADQVAGRSLGDINSRLYNFKGPRSGIVDITSGNNTYTSRMRKIRPSPCLVSPHSPAMIWPAASAPSTRLRLYRHWSAQARVRHTSNRPRLRRAGAGSPPHHVRELPGSPPTPPVRVGVFHPPNHCCRSRRWHGDFVFLRRLRRYALLRVGTGHASLLDQPRASCSAASQRTTQTASQKRGQPLSTAYGVHNGDAALPGSASDRLAEPAMDRLARSRMHNRLSC